MPVKTPVELAQDMLLECSGPNCTVARCRVARELITMMAQVECRMLNACEPLSKMVRVCKHCNRVMNELP